MSTSGLSVAALQVLTPLGLALLLYHFYRRHRKNYILSWASFWMWSALFALSGSIAFAFQQGVPFESPRRWIPMLISSIAGFLALGHLIGGGFSLVNRRPMRIRVSARLFPGLVALGVLTTVYLLSLADREILLRFGHMAIFALSYAITFLAWSVIFWRHSKSERTSWILLAVTFGIFGAMEVVSFLLEIGWIGTSDTDRPAGSPAILSAFLQGMIGLAMAIRLLDDEREAALVAASQVEHMAYHDDLTGLPNRALFFDRLIMALTQAERRRSKVAVLFVDLDHFKNINDSLGHAIGDALLRITADRIQSVVRKEDTVARFGGDEFVILMPDIRVAPDTVPADDTVKVARKVIDTIRQPFSAYEREMIVTSSVGIAIFPEDGDDADTLVRNADTAMYRAKERGRNRHELYTSSMNTQALERLELEMSLRRALDNQELELYYQPLVEAATRRLIGFEALVRWRHPSMGIVLPDRFVPAAERCGLIVSLGEWVLNEACHQISIWNRTLGRAFFVSINFSSQDLMDDNLISRIQHALSRNHVNPGQLEIEITESSAFRDREQTARVLEKLRELGIRIAIDDFGSGYSSLGYLKSFPVDTLKIDRLFLADLRGSSDAAIASSVISMAHGMNLKVVAEGVENIDQLSFLSEKQCDRYQGFLFSRPLPAHEIEEFIRDCDIRFSSVNGEDRKD